VPAVSILNLASKAVFSTASFAFTSVALLVGSAQAEPSPEAGSSVTANVGPLRNTRGAVACRLYQSSEGFPRTTKGTVTRRVKVTGAIARCTFDRLPPGTYAIAVHHDENDNRKFDTNLLGIPLEGYGASNNHTPALRAPSWEESKFTLPRDKSIELSIALRY